MTQIESHFSLDVKKNEILDFIERDTAQVFSVRGRMRLGGAAVYLGTVPHTGEEEAASACSNLEDIAHEWPTTIHQACAAAHHQPKNHP